MKNMNKRTKIILAIVGVLVVIAIVAGVVMTQTPVGDLFGTTLANLVITPSNPTIAVGKTIGLSVNATYACRWDSSNTAVASILGPWRDAENADLFQVTVQANSPGSATITARTGFFCNRQVTTTVTVVP